ncbi:MAG: HAMP domain-containing histidine kinase, partial [Bacteriovoracaceae bacterium]|nr:HAMP domain-containing histidine kinase [Bacteriovoracaceae bacterium]
MKKDKLIDWKIISAIIWLIFTISLASWWLSLGLKYTTAKRSMIIAEGLTLIVFITGGGLALIYYILQERKRNFKLNQFFASANHELKTYMASLRLRAEGLSEDLQGKPESEDASKIVSDTVRLELQLENSLIFSEPSNRQVFLEDISIRSYLESIQEQWPGIEIAIEGDADLKLDRRMLEVITKNLIQNAIVHAKAKSIAFKLSPNRVEISNDGDTFVGELKKLGEMFYRHQ